MDESESPTGSNRAADERVAIERFERQLEQMLADRLEADPDFAAGLEQDPKQATSPLIRELLGGDPAEADSILATLSVDLRTTQSPGASPVHRLHISDIEAPGDEVEGYGENEPIPYPDIGGGSGPVSHELPTGKGSSNVAAGVMKSIVSLGSGKGMGLPVPAVSVKFEGAPVTITGSPGFGYSR